LLGVLPLGVLAAISQFRARVGELAVSALQQEDDAVVRFLQNDGFRARRCKNRAAISTLSVRALCVRLLTAGCEQPHVIRLIANEGHAASVGANGNRSFVDVDDRAAGFQASASPEGGISPRNPNLPAPPPEAGRPLGIVSGQPTPQWITPPIVAQRDPSKVPVGEGREWLMRMIRSLGSD